MASTTELRARLGLPTLPEPPRPLPFRAPVPRARPAPSLATLDAFNLNGAQQALQHGWVRLIETRASR